MTTGVDTVGELLRADEAILAMIPLDRIKAGALPDNFARPALLIRCVSSVERQPLKRGATTPTKDRVAVTAIADSYRDQRAIIALAKACCAGKIVNLDGGHRASVLTDSTGPDVRGPGGTYEQTIDFRVSYDA